MAGHKWAHHWLDRIPTHVRSPSEWSVLSWVLRRGEEATLCPLGVSQAGSLARSGIDPSAIYARAAGGLGCLPVTRVVLRTTLSVEIVGLFGAASTGLSRVLLKPGAIWRCLRARARARTHTHTHTHTQETSCAHYSEETRPRRRRRRPPALPHLSLSTCSPFYPRPQPPRRTTPPPSRTSAGKRTEPNSKTTRTSWPQSSPTSTPNGLSRPHGVCFSISFFGWLWLETRSCVTLG